jgi:serine/threonine-protein kinase
MAQHESIIGKTIAGKYIVKSLLGVGGMGSVYEGRHVEIGKRVAIKIIDGAAAQSAEIAARFRREARSASAVESEHILHVFDVGSDPEFGLYMVMEFLTGEDLGVRLGREPRLDPQLAVSIATQIARGLAKAHGANVVHRDLKPGNIFLTTREDGSLHAKIVDFGISKLTHDDPALSAVGAKLTRVGTAIGTPQYMSPEQAQGLPNVDHRTDIWSLATVLYEMLAGRAPYDDLPTYEQTIIQIVTRPTPPLHSVAPWVDARLAAIVDAALKHDPDERTSDAATLVRQLTGLYDWRSATASASGHAVAEDALAQTLPLQGPVTTGAGVALASTPTPPARANSGTILLPAPEGKLVDDEVAGLPRRSPWVPIVIAILLTGAAAGGTVAYLRTHTSPAQPTGIVASTPTEPTASATPEASTVTPVALANSAATESASSPAATTTPAASASAHQTSSSVPSPASIPSPPSPAPTPRVGLTPSAAKTPPSAPRTSAPPTPPSPPPTPGQPAKFGGVDVSSEY